MDKQKERNGRNITCLPRTISPPGGVLHDKQHRNLYIEEYALPTGIRLADALVFATAFENSLCLCSGNRKHYQAISSLETVFFKADNTF